MSGNFHNNIHEKLHEQMCCALKHNANRNSDFTIDVDKKADEICFEFLSRIPELRVLSKLLSIRSIQIWQEFLYFERII